jgi:carboxyl-terminal processing protease
MTSRRLGTLLCLAALLSGCGGGGGSSNPPNNPGGSGPPPPAATCSLRDRQDWAAAQIREWYFFPDTLPASLDPAPYNSVTAYIDALTATARAQGRDRFFTYITSIAEENAFIQQGASAGFGVRLAINTAQRRLFITEAFEGAPALAAGLDRGTEILAIGTSSANLRTVDSIIASEGSAGITNALGPSTAGTTRLLRVTDAGGTREVSVTKADFDLLPVSTRYGARIIDDAGRRVGYINLRTFIGTADTALRNAFAQFRAEGITEIIVDFRYNGGGLVRIADLMGDLLGGNRAASDVFSYTVFRASKSSLNETRNFQQQPQSVSSIRIAFIGTGSTASASELVINAFIPYLNNNVALIGANTFGKPVGQIAIDRAACDDRLRIVAFATQNAARQGDYYNGLAGVMPATCQAGDDISRPLGDPQEASIASALDFLAGRSCAPIVSGIAAQTLRTLDERRELLTPDQPSAAQRDVPGLF